MLLTDEDFYGQVKIANRKPLTEEEIQSVGWYCKNNTKEFRLFLKGKGFKLRNILIPSPEYTVGGVFRNLVGESISPPSNRKEVEFIHNNLYWKDNTMESEDIYRCGNLEQEVTPTVCEIGVTLNTLRDELPEDVRAEFLYHLTCLLEKIRDNL